MQVQITCRHCRKEFYTPLRFARRGRKYCSRICYLASVSKAVHLICDNCGNEFIRKPSQMRENKTGYYCSKQCSFEGRDSNVKCACKQCGKTFEVYLASIKRGQGIYCSMECLFESRRTRKKFYCEECGNEFELTPSQERINAGRFCSGKCYNKWRSQTKKNWRFANGSPYWKKQRKLCLRRDNHTCVLCGGSGNIAHHIIPRRAFRRTQEQQMHALSNLITVCKECHKMAEYDLRYRQRWIDERGLVWPNEDDGIIQLTYL